MFGWIEVSQTCWLNWSYTFVVALRGGSRNRLQHATLNERKIGLRVTVRTKSTYKMVQIVYFTKWQYNVILSESGRKWRHRHFVRHFPLTYVKSLLRCSEDALLAPRWQWFDALRSGWSRGFCNDCIATVYAILDTGDGHILTNSECKLEKNHLDLNAASQAQTGVSRDLYIWYFNLSSNSKVKLSILTIILLCRPIMNPTQPNLLLCGPRGKNNNKTKNWPAWL